MDDLYEYPADHVGRKSYVSVRGHSRSVPKFKTYRGTDGHNHLYPEFGGDGSGFVQRAADYIPDKSPYLSPLDRKVVEGRRAHRDHMKRHDVIEAGDYKIGDYGSHDRAPMPSVRESYYRSLAEYT